MTPSAAFQILISAGLIAMLPLLFLDRMLGGRPDPTQDEMGTNLALGAVVLVSDAVIVSSFAMLYTFLAPQLAVIRVESVQVQFAIALIAGDFLSYWHHRYMHRCHWLWASHIVHHQSRRIELSTGLRNHPFGTISQCVFWAPLLCIGVTPPAMLLAAGLIGTWVMLIHRSENPLYPAAPAWTAWLLNLPAHHREHHRERRAAGEGNFGLLLIVWDRMFGTYRTPDAQAPGYGVVGARSTGPLGELLWGEWRRLLGLTCRPAPQAQGMSIAAGTAVYAGAAMLLMLAQTATAAGAR